jgi:uncharacterized small protein (DUF1192 family)
MTPRERVRRFYGGPVGKPVDTEARGIPTVSQRMDATDARIARLEAALPKLKAERDRAVELLRRLCVAYHDDSTTSGDFAHEVKGIVDEGDAFLASLDGVGK